MVQIAPDPPDYPYDWTPDQRVAAYWHALKIGAEPQLTNDWYSILEQALRAEKRTRAMQAQAQAQANQAELNR